MVRNLESWVVELMLITCNYMWIWQPSLQNLSEKKIPFRLSSQLLLQGSPHLTSYQLQVMPGIAPFLAFSDWKWKLSSFHRKYFLPVDQSASVALLWEQQWSLRVYMNFGLCRSCWLSLILLLELLVFGDLAGNHIS